MRKQTDHNILIGRIENTYVVLQYTFDHGDGFKGATGSSFDVVTNGQHAENMDPENFRERVRELWEMSVKDGATEESLDTYVEDIMNDDPDSLLYDHSYHHFHDMIMKAHNDRVTKEAEGNPEESDLAHTVTCTGGGRMFCKDGTHSRKWKDFDELFPGWEKATKQIAKFEKYTMAQEAKLQAEQRKQYQ